MKLKKILVFTLTLAIIISSTLVITSATNTKGSIDFEAGDTKVITPEGPCCPCYGEDPCDPDDNCTHTPDCDRPCDCLCHDPDEGAYNDFWLTREITDDLYFGSHSIRDFGRFDSRSLSRLTNSSLNLNRFSDNGLDSSDVGQYTGVEVKNLSENLFKLGVEVSIFRIGGSGGTPTLRGAEIRLVKGESIFPASYPQLPGFVHHGETPILIPNDGGQAMLLEVPSANMVKASWSGLLDIAQGTAEVGKAQAELTWTDYTLTP